jgi:predicted ATP-grasp superfamily ATP-dependent carboligase
LTYFYKVIYVSALRCCVVRQSSDLETKKSAQFATSRQLDGLDVPTRNYDVLVLDASLRQSLVSMRSLGQRGLAVVALEAGQRVPAFSSRWCQQGIVAPVESGTQAYLDFVEQCLERTKARVLISSSDSTVALIRQHRERLEKHTAIALAHDPALAIAINKEQTLEIARQLGLQIPRGVTVSSLHDVTMALKEIGLPAVIKPIESWSWDGSQDGGARFASRLVTSADEARIAVEDLTRLGGTTLFQQFLTGRREAISLLYAKGEVHASFAQWAKRTEPQLGGTSVLRQSIALPPDTGAQAEHLVREIDLEGYSEVEFRRDSAGTPFLMEINPRLSASVEIAVRSGVDFPTLLYQWASGERIDTVKSYRVGGWMRYLKGDIMTTIEAVQQRGRPGVAPPAQAVFSFALSCLKPMRYDGVDWHDLAPAIQATTEFTRDWVGGAVLKRLSRLQRSFS